MSSQVLACHVRLISYLQSPHKKTAAKVSARANTVQKLAGTTWAAYANVLHTSSLSLVYSAAENFSKFTFLITCISFKAAIGDFQLKLSILPFYQMLHNGTFITHDNGYGWWDASQTNGKYKLSTNHLLIFKTNTSYNVAIDDFLLKLSILPYFQVLKLQWNCYRPWYWLGVVGYITD